MRIAAIGEGMVELARFPDGGWRTAYGGDALNTAVHLARMGCDTAFLSALGPDPLSAHLREAWRAEGLDVAHVLHHPTRPVGIYAIETAADGERSFAYWRSASAARDMFGLPEMAAAIEALRGVDLLYLSLITLAILPVEARRKLFRLCRDVRSRGGLVAFDSNYRPALWGNVAKAHEAVRQMAALTDIALPTLDDERLLFGDRSTEAVVDRWQGWGVGEVVVKLGAEGCVVAHGAERIDVPACFVPVPVDTSGAGDAFNAGYLAARASGDFAAAAGAGHRLAAWVVARRGALPAQEAVSTGDGVAGPDAVAPSAMASDHSPLSL